MLVTHMLRPRRERATQNAYLIILMKFLARLLTLPLNRQSVRHIFGCCDRRKHETCRNGYCECKFDHWVSPRAQWPTSLSGCRCGPYNFTAIRKEAKALLEELVA